MISIRPTRRLVPLMAIAGLLVVAGPAGASGIVTDNKDPDTRVALVFSGDAYDNEMGLIAGGEHARARPVLMADMGGQ
jgi:hypothetical protein